MDSMEKELLKIGFKPQSYLIHFGVCDNQINFAEFLKKYKIGLFYLGVDADDKITKYMETYKEYKNYSFTQTTIQNFLDTEIELFSNQPFDYIVITGIFDKPVYEEKQYIFISTVLNDCFKLAKQVVFTLDITSYNELGYSLLYVINNVISNFSEVEIKKLDSNRYIFSITK